MKAAAFTLLAAFAVLAAYLLLWPVPIEPVAWQVQPDLGYTGVFKTNARLSNLNTIDLHGEVGPETIAVGPDGRIYTGVLSGKIVRMQPDGSGFEVFANTGGRPLGVTFDAAGNLIVADCVKGLLSVSADGKVSMLTDNVSGEAIRYADAAIVAQDGRIYFSDASRRFAPKDWGGSFNASVMDMLEGQATGRILVYDPGTKTTTVMIDGLSFANGVALSQDQQWLFVNETGKFRVWKVAIAARNLHAAQPGNQAIVVLDNLPGYPDNLMRGKDGRIWLGLAAPRSPDADHLADKPWLRKVVMRLPRSLWPVPKVYGHVLAFTEDGRIVADLQDPSGVYPTTTAVTETTDRLYVQSLDARGMGWVRNR